ncbi:hypothetical protein [Streptomyces griseoaurantiacus]|uniref:hypothetical protein n=1 Tax=Streptomyces griseoaurantiacus TaxID=68213 RepID=UPI003685FF6E
MTSAPFSLRTTTAAAAALTAALALTACSGDDSGEGASATPGTTTSTAATGSATASPGGTAGKLEGSWLTTAGGKAVALVVTGKQAGLFATGGTVCSGTAGKESGTWAVHLTECQGTGDDSRKTGTVDSVTATSLKITWKGGAGTETYRKSDGTGMPSGFPLPDPSGS